MRRCAWCQGPIPAGKRRDAVTCSKPCRQARHRFLATVGTAARPVELSGRTTRRLAYADPPYPGLSSRYYGDHPDYAGEVDHAELVASLAADFDAWALSTSAAALPAVLALCPPSVRVAAWVKGARPNRAARGPVSSWEPVIYAGNLSSRRVAPVPYDVSSGPGERDTSCPPASATPRADSLVLGVTVRRTDPLRVIGAKPAGFCRWIFELLDAQPGDTLVDVFPGSGGVARAWDAYVSSGSPRHVEQDLLDA